MLYPEHVISYLFLQKLLPRRYDRVYSTGHHYDVFFRKNVAQRQCAQHLPISKKCYMKPFERIHCGAESEI